MQAFEEAKQAEWLAIDLELQRKYGAFEPRDEPRRVKQERRWKRSAATRKLKRTKRMPPEVVRAVKVQPGVGKTSAIVSAIAKMHHRGELTTFVDVYEQTLAKAEELRTDLEDLGVPVAIERGRQAADPEYDVPDHLRKEGDESGRMCPAHERARLMSEAGVSVTREVCSSCIMAEFCSYLKQKSRLEKVAEQCGTVIRTHARTTASPVLGRSTIAVVDEDLTGGLVRTFSLSQALLSDGVVINLCAEAAVGHEDIIAAASRMLTFAVIRNDPRAIMENSVPGPAGEVDAAETFDAWEGDPDDLSAPKAARRRAVKPTDAFKANDNILNQFKRILQAGWDLAATRINATLPLSELETRLHQSRIADLRRLLKLTREVQKAAAASLPLQMVKWRGDDLIVAYAAKPRFKRGTSVLFADATLRQATLAAVLGTNVETKAFDVDSNLVIRRCRDSGSKARLLGIDARTGQPLSSKSVPKAEARRRAIVEDAIAAHPDKKTLFVSNIAIEEAIQADGLPEPHKTAHFQALRGLNEYSDFDVVVIIGQALPGVEDLEHQTAALALLEGQAIKTMRAYLKAHPKVELRNDGLINGPNGPWHPCRFVRRVIQSLVDSEYVQSAGRIRAVNSATPKHVIIISDYLPTGLARPNAKVEAKSGEAGLKNPTTVDVYVQRHLKDGFVCMSAPIAYRLDPDLWSSAKAAEKAFERHRKEGGEQPDISIKGKKSECRVVPPHRTYRVMLAGSRRPVSIHAAREVAKEELEAALCPVRWVRDDTPDSTIPKVENREAEPTEADPNALHVLAPRNGEAAAKRYERVPSGAIVKRSSYSIGETFRHAEVRFDGTIEGLSAALTKIARRPDLFVTRGALLPGTDPKNARRALKPKVCKRTGKRLPATMADVERSWLMADIDRFRLPAGIRFDDDHRYAVEIAIRALPEPFREASCHVALSNSAGMGASGSNLVKVHLWFCLEKPMTGAQLKAAVKAVDTEDMIDRAPLNALQPHYIADPICTNFSDPVGERSWLHQGTVDKVALEVPEIRPFIPRPPSEIDISAAPRLFQIALTEIGEQGRGFQDGVLHAASKAAIGIRASKMPRDQAVTAIADTVRSADPGHRSQDDIERYASAEFIGAKIDWFIDAQSLEQGAEA